MHMGASTKRHSCASALPHLQCQRVTLGEGSKAHEGLGHRDACASDQLPELIWAVQATASCVQNRPPGGVDGVHDGLNLLQGHLSSDSVPAFAHGGGWSPIELHSKSGPGCS